MSPNTERLEVRLGDVVSRHPRVTGRSRVTRAELAHQLRSCLDELTDSDLEQELAPVLPPDELVGLQPRLRAAITRLAERLED